MRLCRFGDGRLGVVEGENGREVTAALEALSTTLVKVQAFSPSLPNKRPLAKGEAL
jgi:hypothetical protein